MNSIETEIGLRGMTDEQKRKMFDYCLKHQEFHQTLSHYLDMIPEESPLHDEYSRKLSNMWSED